MINFLRILGAALALAFFAFIAPAEAVQSSGCMPVTGQVSGLQFSEDVSGGLAALISTNSGGVAPVTDCSGQTVLGQQWFDTSLSTPAWRMWDGAQGIAAGYFDLTNHLWLPVMGGGVASVASAATVDLCAYGGSLTPQNYLTITGTVSITSFGASCQLGQIKRVGFAGTLVIAYSTGNILTQTGQSITTANGDQAELIYLGGGVWRVLGYQTVGGNVPVGTILATAGAAADPGYLLAYGECVAQATYPALYARIGANYGSCATGQFAVPDLRGRMPAGQDNMGGTAAGRITLFNAQALGNTGGVQSSVVQQGNLASFNLPASASSTASVSGGVYGGTYGKQVPGYSPSDSAVMGPTAVSVSVSTSVSVSSGGGNVPLPTLPPTQIVVYQIKY